MSYHRHAVTIRRLPGGQALGFEDVEFRLTNYAEAETLARVLSRSDGFIGVVVREVTENGYGPVIWGRGSTKDFERA